MVAGMFTSFTGHFGKTLIVIFASTQNLKGNSTFAVVIEIFLDSFGVV